jgi:cyclopropane-fatty-acyl-phospholipid synthase
MRYLLFVLFASVACLSALPADTLQPSDPKHIVIAALQEADIHVNGKRPWDITVHNEDFYSKVLSQGSLGLGESYMDGWWDCDAIDEFIYRVILAKLDSRVNISWNILWGYCKAHVLNLQDKVGSLKVIDQHYQLGNDLYKNMLDNLMAYSCGYWKNAATLDEAQEAKFDLICRKLGFQPGMDVLDIGCGWGGFEKYAADHYGVHVVGITLSTNQASYAQELCKGLPVEIRVEDYRDVKGTFDRIIEIGMFEHVGEKNYREFFEIVHRSLKPGGMLMLHTIGNNVSTYATDPWINKYIFPNGHLPSISQIGKAIENLFIMEDWHNFGPHYDRTLMAWYDNFQKNWDKLKSSYNTRFFRMWKYYLLSCAGGFRSRDIQLWQVVLSKDGVQGLFEMPR